MQHTFDIVQVVATLTAFIALTSRLFIASRPFWSRFPAWAQTLLPVLVPTLTATIQGLAGVRSWSDLSVLFVVSAGMLLPGLPSNRSAAPLQAGKEVKNLPSAGDVAVAEVVAQKISMRPPSAAFFPPSVPPGAIALLFAIGFSLLHSTGCGAPKSAADVPHEIAIAYAAANAALEVADTAETAYLDSLTAPTDEQIAKAEAVVDELKAARSLLVLVHDDLQHGREKLLEALSDVRTAAMLADGLGIKIPAKVGQALDAASEALK